MGTLRLVDSRDIGGTWLRLLGVWVAVFLGLSVWIRNRPHWLPHGRIQVALAPAAPAETTAAAPRRRFTITNRGNGVLRILAITPGCGCTAAVAGANTLSPRQNTFLEVTLPRKDAAPTGPKRIWISTDDPVEPSVMIDANAAPISLN